MIVKTPGTVVSGAAVGAARPLPVRGKLMNEYRCRKEKNLPSYINDWFHYFSVA